MSGAAERPVRLPRRRAGGGVTAVASAWLLAMLAVAVLADVLAPFGYAEQDLMARLQPPAFQGGPAGHLLGTDHLGRDVLSRVLHAVRVSTAVAVAGAVIGALVGSALGVVAGHFRGVVEDVVMGLVDVQAALPFIIFAILVVAFFGNDLVLFVVLVGLQGWERYARLVRGLVLDARTQGYALAARSLGVSPARAYLHHILPNVAGAIVVQFTLNLPETILLESGLSFLGLGVQPPLTSLGLMLNDSRNYIALYWWLPAVPGLAIFLTALSISLLGDAVRDRLDASLR